MPLSALEIMDYHIIGTVPAMAHHGQCLAAWTMLLIFKGSEIAPYFKYVSLDDFQYISMF